MNLSQDLLRNLGLAAGLGASVALLLWLFRGQASIRRVRAALFLCALGAGAYLILTGAGLSANAWPPRVALAAGLMGGAYTLLQLFDWLVWEYALGKNRHITIPRLLIDVFNFVALTAAALAILNGVFAVNLNGLLVTSTVVSAVIGLSLQDILGSLVAGLALQLEQPFRVGDWVVVSGQEGQVIQMTQHPIPPHFP